MLPVGETISILTRDEKKPHLIYLPTMELPKVIDKIDVFYAFAKLLKVHYTGFACCGLGTRTGGVSPNDCTSAMYSAYKFVSNEICNFNINRK